jgi:hypothetical protein
LNLDLQRAIHSYQNELWPRHRVKTAVCDAVEGFCEETCVWARGQYEDDYTHKAGCNKYIYRASGGYRFDLCPHCNCRIVERFGILKEEGV